jgi:hypothetical protein
LEFFGGERNMARAQITVSIIYLGVGVIGAVDAIGASMDGEAAGVAEAEATAAAGEGAGTGGWIRVGRWMSEEELADMRATNMMQESTGGGGGSWVASPASPSAYNAAKPGSVYVEFDVPAGSLKPAGSGWARIPGPNSVEGRLAVRKGESVPQLPEARNIEVKATK